MNVTLNGTLTITNNSQRNTLTFNQATTTSGSNSVSDTITLTTGSWTSIPTGSNKDLLLAAYTNNDNINNIYISVGNTGSVCAILTPICSTMVLPYSSSVQVYAKASGSNGTSSFSYTQISMN